jgi:hypothetical protein
MAGQHLPPDHSKGDAATIGGYAAVHARPAAFEGSDGMSYSVDLLADATGEPARPYAAYLLFVRWTPGGRAGVEGHLETDYLVHGATEAEALAALGRLPLAEVKQTLDTLIAARAERTPSRRWWDAMQDDPDAS